MTMIEPTSSASSLPVSRKIVCAVYGAISLTALVATWSQNLAYIHQPAGVMANFLTDAKVNPASRSLTADILLFALAATIMMVLEARKHGVKWVWLYIVGGFMIAVSVTFPLFLIAREIRLGSSDSPRLRNVDTILLTVLAATTLGLTLWVDAG